MKPLLSLLLMLCALQVSASPAVSPPAAEPAALQTPVTVQVEGRDVKLVPPEGSCAYDRRQSVADGNVLDLLAKGMEGTNQLLMGFADCKDLATARAGHKYNPTYYGQVLFPLSAKDSMELGRPQFATHMADAYQQNMSSVEDGLRDASQRLRTLLNDRLQINGSKVLGVVHDNPDMVQLSVMQSVQTADRAIIIIGVTTTTKAGVPISINLYHPTTGADSEAVLRDLSQRGAAYARQLIALNPETAPVHPDNALPHADERAQGTGYAVLTGALLGAFVVITMGAIFMLIQKRRRA